MHTHRLTMNVHFMANDPNPQCCSSYLVGEITLSRDGGLEPLQVHRREVVVVEVGDSLLDVACDQPARHPPRVKEGAQLLGGTGAQLPTGILSYCVDGPCGLVCLCGWPLWVGQSHLGARHDLHALERLRLDLGDGRIRPLTPVLVIPSADAVQYVTIRGHTCSKVVTVVIERIKIIIIKKKCKHILTQ